MSFRHLLGASALLFGVAARAPLAQSTTSLATDATVLPRGGSTVRLLTSWTRWDALYGVPGTSGLTPLGVTLSRDSLGASLIGLTGEEAAIQAAAGSNTFRLNAGKLVTAANSRVVTAPLIAEYGLSDRLTVGLVVPFVQSRTTVVWGLNQAKGFANVGPNPARLDPTVAAANAALVAQFVQAASTLQTRLTSCQANPSQSGCATLNARRTEAQALAQSLTGFATTLGSLYGTGTSTPGNRFVPLASSPAQTAISGRITSFDQQYRDLVGTGFVSGSVTPAAAPAARNEFQSLLTDIGFDTLGTINRTSIGDITIGGVYQFANTFGDTTSAAAGKLRYRTVANFGLRIGTGQPTQRARLFDLGTGYGQHGVQLGAATDVLFRGKYSMSALGSYTKQLGTVAVPRIANAGDSPLPLGFVGPGTYSAGDLLELTLLPRMRVGQYINLNVAYALQHVGADTYTLTGGGAGDASGTPGAASATGHQVGFGVSYSTIGSADRGHGRLPVEMSFSHMETIHGSGGPIAKTQRDQIEVRVYLSR